MHDIIGAIAVLIILLGLSSPVLIICLFYYFKKRLEHKQIIAAIEKGIPLPELKVAKPAGPAWIKNLTAGITLLIIAGGIICVKLIGHHESCPFDDWDSTRSSIVIAIILFAFGISRLIRGLLQRNAEKQTLNAKKHPKLNC